MTLGHVRLERALSKLGVASRSQTQQMIKDGKITVDGKIVRDPNFLVIPETASIAIDGKRIAKTGWQTIMLHKPKGYVTTRKDEKNRQTIYDLLPADLRHLHPVGRLDMASSGLLILTTDTQLSHYLTDPEEAIKRVYVVTVTGRVSQESINAMQQGIEDQGEVLMAHQVQCRKVSHKETHLFVTLTEGKNREIRRMFKALGHEVTALKRIAFGQLTLGDLAIGKYKFLTKDEIC